MCPGLRPGPPLPTAMKAYAMELLTAPAPAQTSPFVDRRQRTLGPACGPDRRQFADSRDNLLEIQVRDALRGDLPLEADLARWMALWGAPGL